MDAADKYLDEGNDARVTELMEKGCALDNESCCSRLESMKKSAQSDREAGTATADKGGGETAGETGSAAVADKPTK